jgi:8-oxo-dGTP pyrophosphatase MutT (NUDIX family)
VTEAARRHTGLPGWWEPLLTRLEIAEAGDFTRMPTPDRAGRQSAVLILLGEEAPDSGPDVLILQRSDTLRSHPGQPAFPGGACDPDDVDMAATALREAAEEVGLDPTTVDVVAHLPTLFIPVSDFLVTPVLGWWRSPHPVRPVDPAEVARVERLPIADLVDPANRLRLRHPSGWIGPAFRVHGMLVWGFTAGVLSTLLEMGGWSVPWHTDRVEDVRASGNPPVP